MTKGNGWYLITFLDGVTSSRWMRPDDVELLRQGANVKSVTLTKEDETGGESLIRGYEERQGAPSFLVSSEADPGGSHDIDREE